MNPKLPHSDLQVYCFQCSDWIDAESCKIHWEVCHDYKNATFESIQERLGQVGAFTTRPKQTVVPDQAPKRKNWLFRDDDEHFFETNNFRHRTR